MSIDPLGIENFGPWYLTLNNNQSSVNEMINISHFVNNFVNREDILELNGNKEVQFINYGSTQLVFVVLMEDGRKYTLLVNQPATTFGVGHQEYENLIELNKIDKSVIEPLYYYENGVYELYMTPYIYQSRCIGVDPNYNAWGYWAPEPFYHFEVFSSEDSRIVTTCMIANLIKLYDEKKQIGIGKVRLDGGDFMCNKGFEDDITQVNVLSNMRLIAARDMVNIPFSDYINFIKVECLKKSYETNVLGKLIKCPITENAINDGIILGKKLKEEKIRVRER